MTLESRINRVRYVGNGAATEFAFPFRAWKKDQVRVYVGDGSAEQDVSAQCHVSLTATGGTVTFLSAPADGKIIVIRRDMPFLQQDDYRNGTRFDAEEVEDRLDQDCAERQQLLDGLSRCVKLPETSADDGSQLVADIYRARSDVLGAIDQASSLGGATLVTAFGSTEARQLQYRFSDIINVRDFGAKGNGTADDHASIQAAINAAASGGKWVFFPAGVYLISKMLTVYSGVSLVGEDKSSVIRRDYDYWYDSSDNPHTLMIQLRPAPADSVELVHDVCLRGMTFDAQGAVYDGIPIDILATDVKTVGLEVAGCRFLDVYEDHALDLGLVSGVHIHDCDFLGWKAAPTTEVQYREAIQFDIVSADADADRSKNVVIECCRFGASASLGGWLTAIGNHGFPDFDIDTVFDSVIIRNNVFKGSNNVAHMIRLYIFSNVVVEGNTFKECPSVLQIRGRSVTQANEGEANIASCSNIVFSKNYVNGNYSSNSQQGSVVRIDEYKQSSSLGSLPNSNIVIADNSVDDVFYFVFIPEVSGASGVCIKNNKVSSYNLIMCVGPLYSCMILGNLFAGCGVIYCQTLEGTTEYDAPENERKALSICDNTWFNPSARCIHIQGMYGLVVKDNIVFDSSTTRDLCYIEQNLGAGTVGTFIKDNMIFASSDSIDDFIVSTYDGAVVSGNKFYVNGVEQS